MQYNILITKGDTYYIARNIELGVVSQGTNIEEAVSNIKEATELYLEDEDPGKRTRDFSPAFLTTLTAQIS